MKLIKAIIKPSKLDEVRTALVEQNVVGMTVSEVRGFGRQRGQSAVYRGTEYQTFYVPKIELEIVVEDDAAEKTVETIVATANTNQIGDGKIFIMDVIDAVRIRTGESGASAL